MRTIIDVTRRIYKSICLNRAGKKLTLIHPRLISMQSEAPGWESSRQVMLNELRWIRDVGFANNEGRVLVCKAFVSRVTVL